MGATFLLFGDLKCRNDVTGKLNNSLLNEAILPD